MTRRRLLVLLVCALLLGDLLFLGWCRYRDTAANARVTYVGLDSATMVVDADVPALSLDAGHWRLGAQPMADPAGYAKQLAAEGHMPAVTAPNYGQLVHVLRDLKARKICNILIREGGTRIAAAPTSEVPDWDTLEIPAIVLCGNAMGDSGFHGSLPADGPIHFSAVSLR